MSGTTDPSGPDPVGPALAELPVELRRRVVALAADVLPQVAELPPALRRVATFAPARRAKVGEQAIADVLDEDPGLRERLGVQAADRAPGSGDVVEAAARAWLVRDEGWAARVGAAVEVVAARSASSARADERLALLQDRLDRAEASAREQRLRHREQVEELKRENSTLRRKLGEARAAERAARAEATEQVAADETALARAEAAARTQEKEARRLRQRIAELEAEVEAGRRSTRLDRDEVTVRARLLLETVIDAASGLRRELALPAVAGSPADRVEAGLAGGAAGGRSGSAGAMSPVVLEQHLALPRARLLVDGYNVSKSAWPSSSLEAQRIRLVNALAPLVARTGADTTVVFDAADASSRPVVPAPRGVKVLFSPPGVIADDVIRDLLAAEPPGRTVVVVSDDQEVARGALAAGFRAVGTGVLLALVST